MSAWRFCTLSKVNLRSTLYSYSPSLIYSIIWRSSVQKTPNSPHSHSINWRSSNTIWISNQPPNCLTWSRGALPNRQSCTCLAGSSFCQPVSQSVSHCQATNSKYNNMMWLGEIIEQTAIQLRKCNLISINKRKSSLYTRRRWSSGSSISNQPLSIRLPYRSIMMLF